MTFSLQLIPYRCPCRDCTFRCRYKFNLRIHIKEFHPELTVSPSKPKLKGGPRIK